MSRAKITKGDRKDTEVEINGTWEDATGHDVKTAYEKGNKQVVQFVDDENGGKVPSGEVYHAQTDDGEVFPVKKSDVQMLDQEEEDEDKRDDEEQGTA